MPRLARRLRSWVPLALLATVLAAVGLGFGWKWSRASSDLVAQSISAYEQGEWGRAADLARTRLKAASSDLEALRMFARATARLGRDGAANALFARLGSSALKSEDLYLLGLGLSRTGQADKAERLWERALAMDSQHAEALEQLALYYTSRNRLAEAAQLADRLSRLPGWDLRGELILGSLRSELNDPAGAAAVLRQALERPEASRLEREPLSKYRKLLARQLLQLAKPGEARAELKKVLDLGPDEEASWLLSRAELAEGAVGLAAAALEEAGSYRKNHPLESEPGTFVGEARCAECHGDIFEAQQASRHSSTLLRGEELAAMPFPDRPVTDPDDPTVTHFFRREGGLIRFETRAPSTVFRAVVQYAFGSRDHYASLVGADDQGKRYILRLSHYQSGRDSGWVRTTGHSADAGGGRDLLGKPLESVDGIQRCLFCHSTNPRAVFDQSGPESNDRGIGCERCHGPGGLHVKAVALHFRDRVIVNPKRATSEGKIRVCGQCHSFHQELSLPHTDSFWIRFQATTLPWSRCYTESAGALDCTTCHDPHRSARAKAEDYTAKCSTCHPAGSRPPAANPTAPALVTRLGVPCPVSPTRGCVGCHMPPFWSEPIHATFTDHYIRVHTDLKTQSLKRNSYSVAPAP